MTRKCRCRRESSLCVDGAPDVIFRITVDRALSPEIMAYYHYSSSQRTTATCFYTYAQTIYAPSRERGRASESLSGNATADSVFIPGSTMICLATQPEWLTAHTQLKYSVGHFWMTLCRGTLYAVHLACHRQWDSNFCGDLRSEVAILRVGQGPVGGRVGGRYVTLMIHIRFNCPGHHLSDRDHAGATSFKWHGQSSVYSLENLSSFHWLPIVPPFYYLNCEKNLGLPKWLWQLAAHFQICHWVAQCNVPSAPAHAHAHAKFIPHAAF
jgi:hypothetical protein